VLCELSYAMPHVVYPVEVGDALLPEPEGIRKSSQRPAHRAAVADGDVL
jgi:hypothetical protein